MSEVRPSSRRRYASLPMVVVFPLPFTPTTRTTLGTAPRLSERSYAFMTARISALSAAIAAAPSASFSPRTRWRRAAASRSESSTPQSAAMRTSVRSSKNASSSFRPGAARPCISAPNAVDALSMRPDTRRHQALRRTGATTSSALTRPPSAAPPSARRQPPPRRTERRAPSWCRRRRWSRPRARRPRPW